MKIKLSAKLPPALAKHRLDVVLKELFKDYSRAILSNFIKRGLVKVNGEVITLPRFSRLSDGDDIKIEAMIEDRNEAKGEAINLDIAFEDEDVLVINKPVGLVVHPGAGNTKGTLMNGLLYQFKQLALLPRAGLVHRIDKDTSGLLLIAKNLLSFNFLTKALQRREISREYLALVRGKVLTGGAIDKPIMRDAQQRTRMKVVASSFILAKEPQHGARVREALTYYWVAKRFKHHTLLRLKLATGRTHQIRVHLASIGYPIVGDQVYSRYKGSEANFKDLNTEALERLQNFKHQALHAATLTFPHPVLNKTISVSAPLPGDFQKLIEALPKLN